MTLVIRNTLQDRAKARRRPHCFSSVPEQLGRFAAVNRVLESYLVANLSEDSTFPWSSRIVYVPKKDNSIRIGVDSKRLNAASIVSKWPLPPIDGVLHSLGKGQ